MKYKAMSRTIIGDELLARCSQRAKLLYHRLYLCSDGEMRFYANPATIKGYCFPLDKEIDEQAIIEALGELMRRRRVRFYHAEAQDFLVVLGNRLDKPKPAAMYPAPPSGFSKRENAHMPGFMREESDPEPAGEEGSAPPPPAPTSDNNSDSCLSPFHKRFGLTAPQADRVLGAYCESRRRNNWCDLDQPDICHQSVAAIVERAQKHDAKLRRNGGRGIRDYPSYLSKCLQESLLEDADEMTQTGSR